MRNKKIILIALVLVSILTNVFGQANPYPFQVSISGSGKQNLIFIPGFACSGEVWKETLALYEGRYTCYTLTMAGFASVPAQAAPSFSNWEKGIVDYIRANHIDKPIIVGHSMGGGLALAIAADYPEIPSQIVVVDALPCLAAIRNPAFTSNSNNECSAVVNKFTSMDMASFKTMQKTVMSQLCADTSKLNMIINWSVTSDRATFAIMYCDFMNVDLREKIKGIVCPALIMLEAGFASLKPAIADQYKNLKTAQLVYATKGLHFIMYDDSVWYKQQLQAFIK